jgi:predicted HicB family RNase H-like nuclease
MVKDDVVRSISFRVSDELHEAMRRAADDENRTLSNWIETTCKKAIAELEQRDRDDNK